MEECVHTQAEIIVIVPEIKYPILPLHTYTSTLLPPTYKHLCCINLLSTPSAKTCTKAKKGALVEVVLDCQKMFDLF